MLKETQKQIDKQLDRLNAASTIAQNITQQKECKLLTRITLDVCCEVEEDAKNKLTQITKTKRV